MRRRARGIRWWVSRGAAAVAALTVVLAVATGCSPIYVIKAGIAEAKILRGRRPIPDVILDPATDDRTRGKLTLAREARAYAAERLGLDVGDSYTTFTQLDRDTLAMVLSAAHRDRFAARTWWFPIVGSVPYRGFFSPDAARKEQRKLEEEGFDTYLRPTAAFSTLGWFSDPLLSTVLRYDEVGLVETIIHEVSHNHLFVPGRVTFNESFASFVGSAGAVDFFCRRQGGGPDTVKCHRAMDRWEDEMRFSVFLDDLVAELRTLYGRNDLGYDGKLAAREEIFTTARARFVDEVQPTFEASSFSSFLDTPLNNATLLSRMLYYHRLPDFQALLDRHGGDLGSAVAYLTAGVEGTDDPFTLLPEGGTGGAGPPGDLP